MDLTDRSLFRQGFPHELFNDLRARGAVLRHERVELERSPGGIAFWVVTRYAEVQEVSRDGQRFSALEGPSLSRGLGVQQGEAIVFADAPTHTRLRKLISAGFTPRMIARLDDLVQQRAREIVDAVAERGGEVDFVRDVAFRLPMQLIGDIIGIPEADRDHVFGITDVIMRGSDPDVGFTDAERNQAMIDLYTYANQLGVEKRARPADDVWSLLASAEIEGDDGARLQLSDFQLDMFFLILSVAGSETTRNAISQGLAALAEQPEDLHALRADPTLWDTATDEVIRWASPVSNFARTATCDTELGGVQIAAGDRVAIFYPSANRDERAFPDPFRFDIRRSPNHHVSFGGGGAHYCLGAHLARREIRTMFEQLLARFDHIEITGDMTWTVAGPDQSVAVSVDTMPVRLS
jgi:cytochrome P450